MTLSGHGFRTRLFSILWGFLKTGRIHFTRPVVNRVNSSDIDTNSGSTYLTNVKFNFCETKGQGT